MRKPILICLTVAFFSLACSRGKAITIGTANGATQGQTTSPSQGELKFKVPDGWVVEHPTSSMRVAQYKLPKADGDNNDASLVLCYFGQDRAVRPRPTLIAGSIRYYAKLVGPEKTINRWDQAFTNYVKSFEFK